MNNTDSLNKQIKKIAKGYDFFNMIKYRLLKTNPFAKLITVTSVSPKEGRTFISIGLATVFAMQGERTVIVETNFESPSLNKFFKLTKDQGGLIDYLSGKSMIKEVIISTNISNLSLIPAGRLLETTTSLDEKSIAELIQKLTYQYDKIIIDTSALAVCNDSMIMIDKSDVHVLVTKSGTVKYEIIQKYLKKLIERNSKFGGVIINKYKE
ncbi:CpsD/CapB family tyrosine-protein kinase [Streptococcus porcorum]|uniref:Tyrosine-protein kinase CpsD n=1 Tax=Streptococcus porcorum TaxID=701526 RepID=A0ABV2JH78_9STRE